MWWFSFFKFINGLNPSSELQKLNLEIGFIGHSVPFFELSGSSTLTPLDLLRLGEEASVEQTLIKMEFDIPSLTSKW